MAGLCDGSVIFFGTDPRAPVIAMHRVQGGRAVFLDGTRVILADGDQEAALMDIQAIPLTEGATLDAQHRSAEHTSELQSLIRISYAVFCLNKTKSSHSITTL